MTPTGKLFDRAVLIVLDSVGIGGAPDAAAFGDDGADTLGHIHAAVGLALPVLGRLGLRRLLPLGDGPVEGAWGIMCERSAGKDTTTGHFEIAGAWVRQPFPVYPAGFPPAIVEPWLAAIGRDRVLCNRPASGTDVIEEFGREHLASGAPILYTSADSVFQVAAHEGVVPLETLYAWCRAARELLRGPHEVGRVIARPFLGEPGAFVRDQGARRDFSVEPPEGCLPQALSEAGLSVAAVGKIEDIYAGRGITEAVHTRDNAEGLAVTIDLVRRGRGRPGIIFTNLVDFDSKFGHRRDVAGYARALEEADGRLPALLAALEPRDALFVTADHGNDPTFTKTTDHTRERVPLLCWRRGIRPQDLGVRETYADLGQTIAANFGLAVPNGTSFLESLGD
jgi:phosphopentomutase